MIGSFEELQVWKEARVFRIQIAALVKNFPSSEKFRLTDQLIRASRSVTANIAEGYGRYHYQENIQFCRQARGSLTECLDHLICSLDECYLTDSQLDEMKKQYELCLKLLNGYIAYLQKMKAGNNI